MPIANNDGIVAEPRSLLEAKRATDHRYKIESDAFKRSEHGDQHADRQGTNAEPFDHAGAPLTIAPRQTLDL